MGQVTEIREFIDHLEEKVDKAFDGEKFDVKIQIDGKELGLTLNADIYESLRGLLLTELDWFED